MQETFFHYQRKRLTVLFGWGILSTVYGLCLQLHPDAFWRMAGRQDIVWGAIDALIARFGMRGARKKQALAETKPIDEQKEARGFRRILLINVLLDIGYVVGGIWIMRRFRQQNSRRGTGFGILGQGLFLLLFDSFLTLEVGRRWNL